MLHRFLGLIRVRLVFISGQKKEPTFQSALCGGTSEIRTSDTWIFSPLLYQLSYGTSVVLQCKDTTFFNTANKKIYFF